MKLSKSVVCNRYGAYDSLQVCNHPLRPMNDDDVTVSVHFCGLNFADLYTRQGLIRKSSFPFVLGMECTGIITELGSRLKNLDLKVGKKVVCYDHMGGMYSEIVVVNEKHVFLLPDDADLKLSASIFVNFLTAYFCIEKLGALRPNDRLLIHSCAGGVGWAATQIAKRVKNVTVYGTASQEKREAVKENGVDYVFDYESFDQEVQMSCPSGFDLILDNKSLDNQVSSYRYLRTLGRIVVIGANNLIRNEQKLSPWMLLKAWWRNPPIPVMVLMNKSQSFSGFHLGNLAIEETQLVHEVFNCIYDDVISGKLRPRIHAVFPFDEIVKATKLLAERKNIGKILLKTNNAQDE